MSIPMNPFFMADFYKVGHVFQYPEGTEKVYSNFTPRKSRLPGINSVVFFGLQYFIQAYLIDFFNDNFFRRPWSEVGPEYKELIRATLGGDLKSYDHLEKLHRLGYLPLQIKAVPEGTIVPVGVPCLTVTNTHPDHYWLPNFIETLLSACLWQPTTSATIAYEYRKLFRNHARMTGMPENFTPWQGHDFSFRGMSSPESAILSGMGHLTSFAGTDTIPAIPALCRYYGANINAELIGGSVPATEHSVMSVGQCDNELDTFRRIVTKVYPKGIVSVVSDTWDLWQVCTKWLPALKDEIMARSGKVVIRPDSGDPVKILCGDPDAPEGSPQFKGVIELLWDVFGGTTTPQGYRVLDSHIGAIYGDAITLERADQILSRLAQKGFASQPVFGIGSFTYQYNTRDTFGWAMKATYAVVNGQPLNIWKNPVTDTGEKKSACGLLMVYRAEEGRLALLDKVTPDMEEGGELKLVFEDGKFITKTTLAEIRGRLGTF
jgi:nicotinamide phosphoribosyltransferase